MHTYTDKYLLTHFHIPNMMEELESNKVSKSRRNEIVRAYKKVLNDNQYYCISPMNFIKDRLMKTYKGKGMLVDNFKFGYYGSTIYLCEGTVEFNGRIINVISQFVYPKTSWEFHHYDDYTTLYFSKSDIDKVCEELEA